MDIYNEGMIPQTSSSWVGAGALIIAVIALIAVIILIIVFVKSEPVTGSSTAGIWIVTTGSTVAATDTFPGLPGTIYQRPATGVATTVNIPSGTAGVTQGSMFILDNTFGTSVLTVTGVVVGTIPVGTTWTILWDSTTAAHRMVP